MTIATQMRYLLDTNVISVLVRDPRGALTRRIAEVGEANVCTSVIVAAELRYGAIKKGAARLVAQLDAILNVLEVLPLEPPVDTTYGKLRTHLEHDGLPIGGNDLLIASQALTLGHTVVTANEREFGRVPGLRIENWLRG